MPGFSDQGSITLDHCRQTVLGKGAWNQKARQIIDGKAEDTRAEGANQLRKTSVFKGQWEK